MRAKTFAFLIRYLSNIFSVKLSLYACFLLEKRLVSFSPLYYCAFFNSEDAISVGAIYVPAQPKVILDLNLHFKIHVDC